VLELIKGANLALRFLWELFALGTLGYWGFKIGSGTIAKIGLSASALRWWPRLRGALSCLLRHRCSCPGSWS
jgi:hypothetical protein